MFPLHCIWGTGNLQNANCEVQKGILRNSVRNALWLVERKTPKSQITRRTLTVIIARRMQHLRTKKG